MWAHQPSPESSQQFWVLKVTAGIAKSTTTPAHMTTSPVRSHRPNQAMTLRSSSKDFTVPTGPPGNAAQPEQQTSHPNRAATPPRHATEPNGAQESPRRVFKPDRKTVVPSCDALSIYWKSQSDPSSMQESLQRPDWLRDTAGTVKPFSARDQTTDQVGNDSTELLQQMSSPTKVNSQLLEQYFTQVAYVIPRPKQQH